MNREQNDNPKPQPEFRQVFIKKSLIKLNSAWIQQRSKAKAFMAHLKSITVALREAAKTCLDSDYRLVSLPFFEISKDPQIHTIKPKLRRRSKKY